VPQVSAHPLGRKQMIHIFFIVPFLVSVLSYPRVSHISAQRDSITGKYILLHGYRYKLTSLTFAFYIPIMTYLFLYPYKVTDEVQLISFYCLMLIVITVCLNVLIGSFRGKVEITQESINARYSFRKSPILLWQNISEINYLYRKRVIQLKQKDGHIVRVSIYMVGLSTFLKIAKEKCPSSISKYLEQWMIKNKFAP
jgi:hypothetical protein